MCPEELVSICEATIVVARRFVSDAIAGVVGRRVTRGPRCTRIVYPASQFGSGEPLPPSHLSRLYNYKKYNYCPVLGASTAAREDIAAWPAAVAANLERFLSASARQT